MYKKIKGRFNEGGIISIVKAILRRLCLLLQNMNPLTFLIRLSMRNLPCGAHITRYIMYERLIKHIGNKTTGKVLSISGSVKLAKLLSSETASIVDVNYPEVNWLQLPFADESFDMVVSDQVLEHIEGDPQHAIDETFRVLNPGGLSICTTCFINSIHNVPGDYWRFTPLSLVLLHKRFGEIIEYGGWGNRWHSLLEWLGLRFDPIPKVFWHPLNWITRLNDPTRPIVVWIAARKSE